MRSGRGECSLLPQGEKGSRAARRLHNPARNQGRHSASKRTSPPGPVNGECLLAQRVEPTRAGIRLDPGVPPGCIIIRARPSARGRPGIQPGSSRRAFLKQAPASVACFIQATLLASGTAATWDVSSE